MSSYKVIERYIALGVLLKVILLVSCSTVDNGWLPNNLANSLKTPTDIFLDHNLDSPALVEELRLLKDQIKRSHNIDARLFVINQIAISYKKPGTSKKDIERFTKDLAHQISSKFNLQPLDDELSITVVISVRDRQVRLRTGKKVREIITDGKSQYIINNVLAYFKRGEYIHGAAFVLKQVIRFLDNPNVKVDNPSVKVNIGLSDTQNDINLKYVLVIIVLVIGIGYLLTNGFENKAESFLKKLKERKIAKNNFSDKTCIICLEDFEEVSKDVDENPEKKTAKEGNTLLECGHRFHDSCLKAWWKKKEECPCCREKIDKSSSSDSKSFFQRVIDIQTVLEPNLSNYNYTFHDNDFTWVSTSTNYSSSGGSDGSGGASGDW